MVQIVLLISCLFFGFDVLSFLNFISWCWKLWQYSTYKYTVEAVIYYIVLPPSQNICHFDFYIKFNHSYYFKNQIIKNQIYIYFFIILFIFNKTNNHSWCKNQNPGFSRYSRPTSSWVHIWLGFQRLTRTENSERLSHDAELIEVTPKIATPIGTHKYLTVTQIYSFAGPKRVRNCGHGS
jgi:hypothetical protein